jgi:hypothetical protein
MMIIVMAATGIVLEALCGAFRLRQGSGWFGREVSDAVVMRV